MAVKRRDPCTKRRGDLRLSRLAPVSALEQSWTARAGPSAQRHGRSLTPAVGTARLAAPLRRRERGEAKKKKERESKTAPPPPPDGKVLPCQIAAILTLGPACQCPVRTGVTAALAGVPRPAPAFNGGDEGRRVLGSPCCLNSCGRKG